MPHLGTIGSDVQGPTIFWDKLERGWYAIPPVSTRVTPGPEHDQHRAMSSSTAPQEFVNQIRAHAPTSSSRQAGLIRPAASLFELRHSSIILGLHCSAVGRDMHARYFR